MDCEFKFYDTKLHECLGFRQIIDIHDISIRKEVKFGRNIDIILTNDIELTWINVCSLSLCNQLISNRVN